jgi:hypothetical protein
MASTVATDRQRAVAAVLGLCKTVVEHTERNALGAEAAAPEKAEDEDDEQDDDQDGDDAHEISIRLIPSLIPARAGRQSRHPDVA